MRLQRLAKALASAPESFPMPENSRHLRYRDNPIADDQGVFALDPEDAEPVARSPGSGREDDPNVHDELEKERTNRVIRIVDEARSELAEALPTSCPSFEAVMHFVKCVAQFAHGRLMYSDSRLRERILEEFLERAEMGPTLLMTRRA